MAQKSRKLSWYAQLWNGMPVTAGSFRKIADKLYLLLLPVFKTFRSFNSREIVFIEHVILNCR